jgi:hypothetical protein
MVAARGPLGRLHVQLILHFFLVEVQSDAQIIRTASRFICYLIVHLLIEGRIPISSLFISETVLVLIADPNGIVRIDSLSSLNSNQDT